MSKPEFSGLILAGGLSTRMGEDKAMLAINGQNMIQRAEKLLFHLGASRVLLSRNRFTTNCLPDIYPQLGPLSGIHSALFAQDLPVLCVPVDMPLLNEELLEELLDFGQMCQKPTIFDGHNLPIYVPNCAPIRHAIEEQLCNPQGNHSIRTFLRNNQSVEIPLSTPEKLVNVNTPELWQQIKHFVQQQESNRL